MRSIRFPPNTTQVTWHRYGASWIFLTFVCELRGGQILYIYIIPVDSSQFYCTAHMLYARSASSLSLVAPSSIFLKMISMSPLLLFGSILLVFQGCSGFNCAYSRCHLTERHVQIQHHFGFTAHNPEQLRCAVRLHSYGTTASSGSSETEISTSGGPEIVDEWMKKRNEIAQQLLHVAYEVGPVGMKTTEENRQKLQDLAQQLSPYSDPQPARVPLTGTHEMLYSDSKGASAGSLGPFVGKVTQQFVNDVEFMNVVQLGPLEVQLLISREVLSDDARIRVSFKETSVNIFGVPLIRKEVKGGGVWKHLFVGQVIDPSTGNNILLRVLEAPSLFIIKQDV